MIRPLPFALASLALLLAPACKKAAPPTPGPAATKIRIAYALNDGVIVWGMVGQIFERTDILQRHGLDATLVVTPDSPNLGWSMIARDADVGLIPTGVMGMILASGLPYDLIAAPGSGGRITLLVKSDSPIRKVADLRGKTVENPILGGLLERFLATADLTIDDIKVAQGYRFKNEAHEDLLSGRIDALMHWDPYIENILSSGQARILIEDPYHLEVMMQRPFVQQHREAAVGFMMALREALHFMLTHEDLAIRWYADASGVPFADVKAALPHSDIYKEAHGKGLEAIDLVPDERKITDLKGVTGAMGRYGLFERVVNSIPNYVQDVQAEVRDAIDIEPYFNWGLAAEANRRAPSAAPEAQITGPAPTRVRKIARVPQRPNVSKP